MSEGISENDPLWFLKHNLRAYGEVKDWLTQKRKPYPCKKCHANETCQRQFGVESGSYGCLETDTIKQYNTVIAELLDDLQNDSKFFQTSNAKQTKEET